MFWIAQQWQSHYGKAKNPICHLSSPNLVLAGVLGIPKELPVFSLHWNPEEAGPKIKEHLSNRVTNFPWRVRASRQKANISFFYILLGRLPPEVWPGFRVSFFSSSD